MQGEERGEWEEGVQRGEGEIRGGWVTVSKWVPAKPGHVGISPGDDTQELESGHAYCPLLH